MNESNVLHEYNDKIEIANLSYVEFKTESIENINSSLKTDINTAKYLRNTSEVYYADVELRNN